jgi:hypothetical protein
MTRLNMKISFYLLFFIIDITAFSCADSNDNTQLPQCNPSLMPSCKIDDKTVDCSIALQILRGIPKKGCEDLCSDKESWIAKHDSLTCPIGANFEFTSLKCDSCCLFLEKPLDLVICDDNPCTHDYCEGDKCFHDPYDWIGKSCVTESGKCEGKLECNAGKQICMPENPPSEVCDSIDNDCDGLTDEDLICPCVSNYGCPAGLCIKTGQDGVCAQTCIDSCPDGLACTNYDSYKGEYNLCIPESWYEVEPSNLEFNGTCPGMSKTIFFKIKSVGVSNLIIENIYMKENSIPEFSIESIPKLPATVKSKEYVGVKVKYSPQNLAEKDINGLPIIDESYLLIKDNFSENPVEVKMSGWGTLCKECPIPVIETSDDEFPAGTYLQLIGDQSQPACGNIESYKWKVEQPDGSFQKYSPSSQTPDPTFLMNVIGKYTFCLDVCDSCNICSSDDDCSTTVCKQIEVSSIAGIQVELVWSTPNDPDPFDTGPEAGSDLDLHFAHQYANSGLDIDKDGIEDPWYDIPYDCFWDNKNPNWGSHDPAVDDNPSLDIVDNDGSGPESLHLTLPEDGKKYRVGVHYWNDHGYGGSTATLRIYIYKILNFEASCDLKSLDMWDVATIDWPSGTITSKQCKIMHNYLNPNFTVF